MRLSDLLDVPVRDAAGVMVGGVADLVLVQDGPLLLEQTAAFRVAGLIVVQHQHVRLLGYERDLRPMLFCTVVRRLAGRVVRVPWEDVDTITTVEVRLRVARDGLSAHDRSARAGR
jgi:sporulation protein YlmC with PRC-barrel domain